MFVIGCQVYVRGVGGVCMRGERCVRGLSVVYKWGGRCVSGGCKVRYGGVRCVIVVSGMLSVREHPVLGNFPSSGEILYFDSGEFPQYQ